MAKVNGWRLMAACGGLTGLTGVAAADEPVLAAGEWMPARLAGHVYVNVATGERTVTPAGSVSRAAIYWQNDDVSCGRFFYGQDRPTRDETLGRVKFGSAVVDWGDVAAGSTVTGYDVAYATNILRETAGAGVAGLNMINVFIDDYDGEVAPGSVAGDVHAFIIEDIQGADGTMPGGAGWIYTVDLEGTGLEFTLGAGDPDGDGLHDFGYAYSFEQGQSAPKGIIGPYLAWPFSLGGGGTATGVIDGFDWFNQTGGPLEDFVDRFWFGGGACPTVPYGSFVMNLYGVSGAPGCPRIDYNADGLIDFSDYLGFLNFYDVSESQADLNGDGLVDFADYLEFLTLYDSCAG